MGRVRFMGELTLGDMHAFFGLQVQPPAALTDILTALAPDSHAQLSDVRLDPLHECVTAAPRFVPHNQKIVAGAASGGQISVIDAGAHLLSGVPAVRWGTVALTRRSAAGANLSSAQAALQAFQERSYRFEYWDACVLDEPLGSDCKIVAKCQEVERPDGTVTPLFAQGAIVYVARSLFLGAGANDTAGVSVRFQVGGYWFALVWGQGTFPRVQKSTDGGQTYQDLKGNLQPGGGGAGGSGAQAVMGLTASAGAGHLGGHVAVQALVLNGRLSLSIGGHAAPFVADLRGSWTSVLDAQPGQVRVPPGAAALLPEPPFFAHTWPGGSNPGGANLSRVTVQNRDTLRDRLGISGTARRGDTLAVLDPRITTVEVEARHFTQLSCSLHPMMWAPRVTLVSQPQQWGFTPASRIYYEVHTATAAYSLEDGGAAVVPREPAPPPASVGGAPGVPTSSTGAQVTIATTEGAQNTGESQYALTINNPRVGEGDQQAYPTYGGSGYAMTTATITRVTARTDGIVSAPTAVAVSIPLGVGSRAADGVKAIHENMLFNASNLSISHGVDVTFSNFHGLSQLRSAYGINASGNIGLALRLGLQHMPPPPDGAPLGYQRFYGHAGTYDWEAPPGGNQDTLTARARDPMGQLAQLISAPPNMDLYNHFAAMAFLALSVGIPPAQIGWWGLVPSDPRGPSPGLYEQDQYFLPAGFGMHTWTPINRTFPAIQLMEQIRRLTGFLLYFDAYGVLQYVPWVPANPYTPRRVFTPVPAPGGADAYGGLTEMWSTGGQTSVEDVRNQLLLVGIDPFAAGGMWTPYIEKREDPASILSYPGFQPPNYIGYRSPMVWFDSRFANPAFARKSADRIFRWINQPSVIVRFTTWLQPDLYALDCIWLDYPKIGTRGIPFYIMSMDNVVGEVGGGRLPLTTTITARYLDPFVVGTF